MGWLKNKGMIWLIALGGCQS